MVALSRPAIQPISFAAASNRRVIGYMNEFVRRIDSDLTRTGDPLQLSLRLSETPMSGVGFKMNYWISHLLREDRVMAPYLESVTRRISRFLCSWLDLGFARAQAASYPARYDNTEIRAKAVTDTRMSAALLRKVGHCRGVSEAPKHRLGDEVGK
jgi:hypothetical protein